MKCPYCGKDNNYVVAHTRKETTSGSVLRMRNCLACGRDFPTIEVIRVEKGMKYYEQITWLN